MTARIPKPEYFYELVEGAVYQLPDGVVLVVGGVPDQLVGDQPLLTGEIVLRYGIVTLMPPGEVIIPGLFAAEKGGVLVGREAWDYLQRHFQTHPRADVIGIQRDGTQIQKLVKELDFGVPVKVYAYSSLDAAQPVVELAGVAYVGEQVEVPKLLTHYLTVVAL